MGKSWQESATVVVELYDELYEIEVLGTFHKSLEGQDADGNRGQWEISCDDIEIVDICPSPPDKLSRQCLENEIYSMDCNEFCWEGEHEDEPDTV